MKRIFLLLSLILYTIHSFGQAWTKKKGEGYAQIGISTITANTLFGPSGETLDLRREIQDMTLQGYLEYGITDKFTFNAVIPMKLLNAGDEIFASDFLTDTLESGSLNSLGNISLAGIYGIRQGKSLVISAKLRFDLNTSDFSEETGLRSGFDAFGVAPSINLGFSKNKIFATFETGVNLRSNDYSTQFFTTAQVGTKVLDKIYVIATLESLQSFEDGDFNENDGAGFHSSLYVNDLEFVAATIKFGYESPSGLGVWLASTASGFTGQYVAKAPAFGINLFYKFQKKG